MAAIFVYNMSKALCYHNTKYRIYHAEKHNIRTQLYLNNMLIYSINKDNKLIAQKQMNIKSNITRNARMGISHQNLNVVYLDEVLTRLHLDRSLLFRQIWYSIHPDCN